MKKKIIKTVIIMVLFITGILLTYFVTKNITKNKYEKPEIESLYVFGEKVSVEPKKNIYRIYLDSAAIKWNGDGCKPNPISITFKNGGKAQGGLVSSSNDGSEFVYGFYEVYKYKNGKDMLENDELIDKQTSKKITNINSYDVYIEVLFDKPLKVDKECSK